MPITPKGPARGFRVSRFFLGLKQRCLRAGESKSRFIPVCHPCAGGVLNQTENAAGLGLSMKVRAFPGLFPWETSPLCRPCGYDKIKQDVFVLYLRIRYSEGKERGEIMFGPLGLMEFIAEIFGALVGTFMVNKFFLWIFYKVIYRKKITAEIAAYPAFLLSVIFVFAAHKPHFVFDSQYKFIYLPCLIWWLIFEVNISKRFKKKKSDENQTQEN